jgi:hypothetical protein
MQLAADKASLVFGSQRLLLTECREEKVISLEIAGLNPTAVQLRMMELIEKTLAECMPILICSVLLPFQREAADSSVYVPLSILRAREKDKKDLWLSGGIVLSQAELASQYGSWLVKAVDAVLYDLFYSYRRGTFDSDLTAKLYDIMSLYSLGSSNRPVVVFLDRERLKDGDNFKEAFARAMVRSSVVAPVVSREALVRLGPEHDATKEDNLLIEWIIAIECRASTASRVQKIFPIVFDEGAAPPLVNQQVASLFKSGVLEALSEVVPVASISRAAELLSMNGVTLSDEMRSMTVKAVVAKLLEHDCIQLDMISTRPELYVRKAAEMIIATIRSCTNLEEVEPPPSLVPNIATPASVR